MLILSKYKFEILASFVTRLNKEIVSFVSSVEILKFLILWKCPSNIPWNSLIDSIV